MFCLDKATAEVRWLPESEGKKRCKPVNLSPRLRPETVGYCLQRGLVSESVVLWSLLQMLSLLHSVLALSITFY